MNSVILLGRLTKDPEVRYTNSNMAVARFSLAIDRPAKDGEKKADFPNIVVFGKQAESCERYLHKGQRAAVEGRLQTGSYERKDGSRVYTTEVVVEEQEFAESKAAASMGESNMGGYQQASSAPTKPAEPIEEAGDGFMNIPTGLEEELPFS